MPPVFHGDYAVFYTSDDDKKGRLLQYKYEPELKELVFQKEEIVVAAETSTEYAKYSLIKVSIGGVDGVLFKAAGVDKITYLNIKTFAKTEDTVLDTAALTIPAGLGVLDATAKNNFIF